MQTKVYTLLAIFFLLFTVSCGDSTTENEQDNEIKDDTVITEIENDTPIQNTENETIKNEVIDAKTLILNDEKIVFSFRTAKGKIMSLSMDKSQKYLVYRFGSEGKVELQFPEELTNTFEKFTYNYYMRGGGAANAGLDLNYVSFTGDTHKIIIFEEYSSGDPDNPEESTSVGIRIVDLKTKKETKIEGIEKSKQGSLIDFRDNGLIKVLDGEI